MNIITTIRVLAIIAGLSTGLLILIINPKRIGIEIKTCFKKIRIWTIWFWHNYGWKGLRWNILEMNKIMKTFNTKFGRRMKIISTLFFSPANSLKYVMATMCFFKEVYAEPPQELCDVIQQVIDFNGGLK